jgi:hypothetical protein
MAATVLPTDMQPMGINGRHRRKRIAPVLNRYGKKINRELRRPMLIGLKPRSELSIAVAFSLRQRPGIGSYQRCSL